MPFLPETTNIIQDNSGYNYNGTINGDLTISSDTPTGKYSTVYNGTNSYIMIPKTEYLTKQFTINLWAYRSDWSGASPFQSLISCTESGGYSIFLDGSTLKFYCSVNNNYSICSTSSLSAG